MLKMSRNLEAGNFQSLVHLWACTKYPDLRRYWILTRLWRSWSIILTLIRSCQVHENQNSHWSSAKTLHGDDGTLLSQQQLWPYCKLKMWSLCLEFPGQNNLNSALFYGASCTAQPRGWRQLLHGFLTRAVRRRDVQGFVPHMHIKLIGLMVLLSLTVLPTRLFVSTILYGYLSKWQPGFSNPLSIFFIPFFAILSVLLNLLEVYGMLSGK